VKSGNLFKTPLGRLDIILRVGNTGHDGISIATIQGGPPGTGAIHYGKTVRSIILKNWRYTKV